MQLEHPEAREEPDNILPLINVVFLLLIFFMMFGALHAADFFSVEPPTSASGEDQVLDETVVVVAADGRLAIGDDQLDDLGMQLKVSDLLAERPGSMVLLKADGQVDATRVVEVMELLNAVGVERLLLLALEPESQ